MKRKSTVATLAIGALALMMIATAACSTERTNKSGSKKVDTISVSISHDPTFTRNFNPFSPTSKKSPGAFYIYEPLVRVDSTDSNKVKPWLAKSFKYSNQGKTLTFKLRHDVKWSDGRPLTSEDVKYTLELPTKTKDLGAAPAPDLKSVSTPDKHTAVVHYSKPQLHDLANYGDDPRLIVPAHIWKKLNAKTWTNKTPIGTGAFTLDSFSPQTVKLKTRNHYWHGKFHGLKYLKIKATGSESSTKQLLLKNQLTWGNESWKNANKDFVKKDPKHNHYWVYPTGGSEGVIFNTKKSPTSNLHIRRALYAALNSKKILKLYNSGQKPANPTGLDAKVWGEYMPARLRDTRHEQDIAKARSELEASGYKVQNGNLTKDGKRYPISLKTNSDFGNWSAYTSGMRSQWKDVLGLNVKIKKTRSEQLGEYKENGDFQMLHDYWGGNDIWSSLHSLLSGNYIKPLGKTAYGNYGRFHSAKIDRILGQMKNTRNPKRLRRYATRIEKTVVDQVPYAPITSGGAFIEANSKDWTGWPKQSSATYVPHPGEVVGSTLTMENLKPAKGKN